MRKVEAFRGPQLRTENSPKLWIKLGPETKRSMTSTVLTAGDEISERPSGSKPTDPHGLGAQDHRAGFSCEFAGVPAACGLPEVFDATKMNRSQGLETGSEHLEISSS